MTAIKAMEIQDLHSRIQALGHAAGFAETGIGPADVGKASAGLRAWLAEGMHGEMDYMSRHAELRAAPPQLLPGTLSVISVALDYRPDSGDALDVLHNPALGYISRYALGRDYHKLMRLRLKHLAEQIQRLIAPMHYRVFSDSAPVMEVALAVQAGLGWRGKHSLLLSQQGSWRFLGEIYTDLPLPAAAPTTTAPTPERQEHCGSCRACIDCCPTAAIVAPYRVDARLCISYLTIELKGAIPLALRPLIGNRIYGCDDCQLACPWNRFARLGDPAFAARQGLDQPTLHGLMSWSAADFNERLAGSPIRRIGHERWLRNIAVALGNGKATPEALQALSAQAQHDSPLVREHVAWALQKLGNN